MNNLGFVTVKFPSVTITNSEGFAEDENICRNICRMQSTSTSSKSTIETSDLCKFVQS